MQAFGRRGCADAFSYSKLCAGFIIKINQSLKQSIDVFAQCVGYCELYRHCRLTVQLAKIRRNIMEALDQLAKKAIGLRPLERIRLVEAILYSLDKPDPDIEKSWIAESEARYEAYKRGELEAYDWDEIKKRYER
jgi:putative addiction module component (TIGR02574 family)